MGWGSLNDVTQENIREYMRYDPETGEIFKKKYKGGTLVEIPIKVSAIGKHKLTIHLNGLLRPVVRFIAIYMEGFIPESYVFIDNNVNNLKYNNILFISKNTILTYDIAQKLFTYDTNTGIVYRKINFSTCKKGDTVGAPKEDGYIRTVIFGKRYYVHRLIWLLMVGEFPKDLIDHVDGNPSNNKWDNLREANRQTNFRNSKVSTVNKTGVKGVSFRKDRGKYRVRLNAGFGSKDFIGYFTDFTEAVYHRLAAEQCVDWEHYKRTSSAHMYIKENVNNNIK